MRPRVAQTCERRMRWRMLRACVCCLVPGAVLYAVCLALRRFYLYVFAHTHQLCNEWSEVWRQARQVCCGLICAYVCVCCDCVPVRTRFDRGWAMCVVRQISDSHWRTYFTLMTTRPACIAQVTKCKQSRVYRVPQECVRCVQHKHQPA